MMSVIRQSVIQLGRTTNDDQSFFFLLLITTKINFFLQLNEMKACQKSKHCNNTNGNCLQSSFIE